MGFSVPEKPIVGGKLKRELGLEAVKFASKLTVGIDSYSELAPCFFKLTADSFKLCLALMTRPLNLGLRRRD